MEIKDLLVQIYKVKEWLQNEVGIKDFGKTRIPKIMECLEFLNIEYEKFVKGEKNNFAEIGHDSDAAIIETIALNTIRQGLLLFDKSQMPKKVLKQCLKGSFSSLDEDKIENDNLARNSLYELELGSYLLLNKIKVNHFEDINFNYGKYSVSIQCKRPLSFKSLESNFNKAVQQLKNKNKIDKDINSVGLVAISLEKIYKLDGLRYYESIKDMDTRIANIYNQAVKDIEPLWERKRTTKFIGFILSLKTTCAFKDTKTIKTVNNSIIRCRYGELNSPRRTICAYLNSRLNRQSFSFEHTGEIKSGKF